MGTYPVSKCPVCGNALNSAPLAEAAARVLKAAEEWRDEEMTDSPKELRRAVDAMRALQGSR